MSRTPKQPGKGRAIMRKALEVLFDYKLNMI